MKEDNMPRFKCIETITKLSNEHWLLKSICFVVYKKTALLDRTINVIFIKYSIYL